jgi:hypothetical protein
MNFKIIVMKIETDNMTRRLIYTVLTPGFNAILHGCEVCDIGDPGNI